MRATGLGEQGAQQSQDCAFHAGHIFGAPLRVSWYLVILFIYQLAGQLNASSGSFEDISFALLFTCLSELILIATILTHELGHGSMARFLGGRITQILLWPFGGICFSTRPESSNVKEHLTIELKIVAAGPATHFPMIGIWMAVLAIMNVAWGLNIDNMWQTLLPWGGMPRTHFPGEWTFFSYLFFALTVHAIQLNVMLFLFNVLFPMYPMDGSKILICILGLCCKVPSRTCAWILIGLTTPACLLFIGYNASGLISGGGNPLGAVSVMLGLMCLSESYKLYTLLKERQLHRHPLFIHARSWSARGDEEWGPNTWRLNTAERDDEFTRFEDAPGTVVPVVPFSGGGQVLFFF